MPARNTPLIFKMKNENGANPDPSEYTQLIVFQHLTSLDLLPEKCNILCNVLWRW